MTSRYNLLRQDYNGNINFMIQDTSDSATEAITEIYLDFAPNNFQQFFFENVHHHLYI